MQKSKDTLLEKLHSYLFCNNEEFISVFGRDEQEMVLRLRAAYTKWVSEPSLRDIDMVNFLIRIYGISRVWAYKDLSRIKILIGNVQNAGKEFQRYRATEMVLKGYEVAAGADSHLEIKQSIAMIAAGQALVKIHKLDKNELDDIPWDDIIPIDLEPSTDVSVIGRKKMDNLEELQRKLRLKYGSKPVDTDYTDVTDGG